jgi:hypothetical protein
MSALALITGCGTGHTAPLPHGVTASDGPELARLVCGFRDAGWSQSLLSKMLREAPETAADMDADVAWVWNQC